MNVYCRKIDENYLQVFAEQHIENEISEHFKIRPNGYMFSPKYRARIWDGWIRFYSKRTKTLPLGLFNNLAKFCEIKKYTLESDYSLPDNRIDLEQLKREISKLSEEYTPRDYQLDSIAHGLAHERSIIISPTASGKSFIIYCLTRLIGEKTLIIVPTINLVNQMYSDFQEYNKLYKLENVCKKIYKDQKDKTFNKKIIISTWQSIHNYQIDKFSEFKTCIVDEVHLATGKSIQSIISKLKNTKYRFGLSGTLQDLKSDEYTLTGSFGPIKQFVTTKELIDKNQIAPLKINCISIKYKIDDCKLVKKFKNYKKEIDWILENKQRQKIIVNLTKNLKNNTLVLFQYLKHGSSLYNDIKDSLKTSGRSVYYVSGDTPGVERERIRKAVENEAGAVIVASDKVFSTGANIPSIENVIFSSPIKSKIKTLQSIGRSLRLSSNKNKVATLYDIVDDLSYESNQGGTIESFSTIHFKERVKIYSKEQFSFKIHNLKL